jgi:hypothetical protein
MKFYLCNMTQQRQRVAYRLPEVSSAWIQEVPIGGQIMLSGKNGGYDLTTPEINAVIEQLTPYGMVALENIDRVQGYVPLCYAIDRRIPITAIEKGLRANGSLLDSRGRQMRREAAIVSSQEIDNRLAGAGAEGGVREVDVSVVEIEPRGGYQHADPMGEGIKVNRNAGPAAPPAAPRRGKGRRAA